MSREIIKTNLAPQAIGTYSQAIKNNSTVYISGQIPLVPNTMEIVKGNISAQIHQVFYNLRNISKVAGGNLANIVKLNVFLINFNNYTTLNKIMTEYFSEPYPARTVIGVSILPKDVDIEIDAIMVLD